MIVRFRFFYIYTIMSYCFNSQRIRTFPSNCNLLAVFNKWFDCFTSSLYTSKVVYVFL